jgi:hypothetical protein
LSKHKELFVAARQIRIESRQPVPKTESKSEENADPRTEQAHTYPFFCSWMSLQKGNPQIKRKDSPEVCPQDIEQPIQEHFSSRIIVNFEKRRQPRDTLPVNFQININKQLSQRDMRFGSMLKSTEMSKGMASQNSSDMVFMVRDDDQHPNGTVQDTTPFATRSLLEPFEETRTSSNLLIVAKRSRPISDFCSKEPTEKACVVENKASKNCDSTIRTKTDLSA